MTEKKVFIITILTVFLIGGSVMVLSGSSNNLSPNQNVNLEAPETNYDWAEIKYDGPKGTKTFKIKNNGSETLKLGKIKTSCTCTTAQINIEGNKSPLFSMHGSSSWIGEIAPGKEAELDIVFDQQFHGPTGIGPVERYITVETNDPDTPKLEFYLKGNVVK
jgi:archaellum component FlaG (FlaF/FlaG flagellin family)